jgi:hypothetical protein
MKKIKGTKKRGGHGHSHGRGQERVDLTDEERSERAKKNWSKLRDHIHKMRFQANFLVRCNENNEEIDRESGGDTRGDVNNQRSSKRKSGFPAAIRIAKGGVEEEKAWY